MGRALDHPILGPKFGPIPNAKKYVFSSMQQKKNSQFDQKFFLGGVGGGGVSILILYNTNIVTYLQFHRIIEYKHNCFFLSLFP